MMNVSVAVFYVVVIHHLLDMAAVMVCANCGTAYKLSREMEMEIIILIGMLRLIIAKIWIFLYEFHAVNLNIINLLKSMNTLL